MLRNAATAVALAAALVAAGCTDDGGGEPAPSGSATAAVGPEAAFTVSGDVTRAAAVLRARLAAYGVQPGEARVEESRVTFAVSRTLSADEANALSVRGDLAFRPVKQAQPAGDCADESSRRTLTDLAAAAEPTAEVTACDVKGEATYVLAPAEARGADVSGATAETPGGTGDWLVALTMRSKDAWRSLTEKHVGDQLAIVVDGAVRAAPTVNEPIPDGSAHVAGDFDEKAARLLAAALAGGALPGGTTAAPA